MPFPQATSFAGISGFIFSFIPFQIWPVVNPICFTPKPSCPIVVAPAHLCPIKPILIQQRSPVRKTWSLLWLSCHYDILHMTDAFAASGTSFVHCFPFPLASNHGTSLLFINSRHLKASQLVSPPPGLLSPQITHNGSLTSFKFFFFFHKGYILLWA